MRSYFVSDIHLSNKNKALSDAFINFLNEINTIPGFTKNSMFPMLWEASGLKIEQLVAKLVDISLDL